MAMQTSRQQNDSLQALKDFVEKNAGKLDDLKGSSYGRWEFSSYSVILKPKGAASTTIPGEGGAIDIDGAGIGLKFYDPDPMLFGSYTPTWQKFTFDESSNTLHIEGSSSRSYGAYELTITLL